MGQAEGVRTRRGALLAVVWTAGVLLATAVGMVAVLIVRDQVGDPATQPLSAADIGRGTASAVPTPRATPAPTPTRPSGAAPSRQFFTSGGGTVSVECPGPRLVYALPAAGWTVDKQQVEAGQVDVRFRRDGDDARIRVGCVAGKPVAQDD